MKHCKVEVYIPVYMCVCRRVVEHGMYLKHCNVEVYMLVYMCVCRRVVKHGMFFKHWRVEVYLMELKLSIHPVYNQVITWAFSKGDTVGM